MATSIYYRSTVKLKTSKARLADRAGLVSVRSSFDAVAFRVLVYLHSFYASKYSGWLNGPACLFSTYSMIYFFGQTTSNVAYDIKLRNNVVVFI